MDTFNKLSILLNKLYRHYGTRKNQADGTEADKNLYGGVYNALRVGIQLVNNSDDPKVLLALSQREIDKFAILVSKHPAPKNLTTAQYEECGNLMGYSLFNRVVANISEIDVNERFVLQNPLMKLGETDEPAPVARPLVPKARTRTPAVSGVAPKKAKAKAVKTA